MKASSPVTSGSTTTSRRSTRRKSTPSPDRKGRGLFLVPEEQQYFITQRAGVHDHRRLVSQSNAEVRARHRVWPDRHPGAGGRRRVGDLGRRVVDGHPAGRQEPGRRLAVHAVHRGRAGAAQLHHRDRAPADVQQLARGRRASSGPSSTSSSPRQLLPTAKNRPPLPVGARYWDELTSAWERIFLNRGGAGGGAGHGQGASPARTARVLPDRDCLIRRSRGGRRSSRPPRPLLWHRVRRCSLLRREAIGE